MLEVDEGRIASSDGREDSPKIREQNGTEGDRTGPQSVFSRSREHAGGQDGVGRKNPPSDRLAR